MRVLVVEDDRTIAESIRKGLRQEGFAADVCYDGESGYLAASNDEYDAIILDILLPGMTGIELVGKLRQSLVHTPVLILSARDQTMHKIEGLHGGADDYLVKPFSFEELLARMHALLRRPHVTQSSVLEANDLKLDLVNRTVTRADQPINLSVKEFALLEYLLRNKGQVLSKNSIITHVWDFDADILPHTVEVFMAHLRMKIDKPFPGSPIVKTIRGFGYKIEDQP